MLHGCQTSTVDVVDSLFRSREALRVPDQPVQQTLAVLHQAGVLLDKRLVRLQQVGHGALFEVL